MFTGIFSDGEGWNQVKTFDAEEKCIKWFMDNGIDITKPEPGIWWNPSPTIIVGDTHEHKQFPGFRYS